MIDFSKPTSFNSMFARLSLECTSHKTIGILGALPFFGIVFGCLWAPRIADLKGRRLFALAGNIVQLIVLLSYRHITSIQVMFVVHFFFGIGFVGNTVIQYFYMMEMMQNKYKVRSYVAISITSKVNGIFFILILKYVQQDD